MRGISLRDGGFLSCWIGLDRGIRSMLGTDIGHNSNSDSRSYPFGLEGMFNMSSVIESCKNPILGPLGELDRVPSHRGSPKLNANLVPCACVAFFWKPQSRASAFWDTIFPSRFIPLLPERDGPALVELLSVRCSSRVVGRWNIGSLPQRHSSANETPY